MYARIGGAVSVCIIGIWTKSSTIDVSDCSSCCFVWIQTSVIASIEYVEPAFLLAHLQLAVLQHRPRAPRQIVLNALDSFPFEIQHSTLAVEKVKHFPAIYFGHQKLKSQTKCWNHFICSVSTQTVCSACSIIHSMMRHHFYCDRWHCMGNSD